MKIVHNKVGALKSSVLSFIVSNESMFILREYTLRDTKEESMDVSEMCSPFWSVRKGQNNELCFQNDLSQQQILLEYSLAIRYWITC
jgi:hypothetical protein